MAALIIFLVVLIALVVMLIRTEEKVICKRCRYMAKRNKIGIKVDTCTIWGCPANVEECNTFDEFYK